MKKRKRLWSILICCVLLLSGIPQTAFGQNIQERATGTSVTVSTPEQFETALKNPKVTEITVSKRITLCGTAESADYSISPVMIRGDVTIKGSGDGAGILTLRSPIQLTGDNVTFKDIEMNFISSGALGSVPHREIFLAGHTLTLDNVNCYTKGSDGSLGGFGGNEAELLPTVYGGGYRNTTVGTNAGLAIRNSNDKTNLQAIYAGHDNGKDNKVTYTGSMNINIDARAAVRDGIFASANTENVNITVTGKDRSTCRTKSFEGNKNTTITFDDISVNRIPVKGGNIVLKNSAIFEPVAKGEAVLESVDVKQGAILNLASMPGTVINGNFTGGGTLILDKEDTLTIKGAVSGDTTFKTWGGSLGLNGSLIDGKAYITCTGGAITGESFKLDSGYDSSQYTLAFDQATGTWTAKNNTPAEDREVGSFEVLSSPEFVDYDVVAKESLSGDTINPSQIFMTETRDDNGEVYIPEFNPYVIRVEDVENRDKRDWGTGVFIWELGNWQEGEPYDFEGNYYIYFGINKGDDGSSVISGDVKPGRYKVFFTMGEYDEHESSTVGEIIDDSVGSAEFTIYKNEQTSSPTNLTKEHISPIPDQKYTGKEIKPSVEAAVGGTKLTEGTDYILEYKNNVEVTTDSSNAKVIVKGIGAYKGTVEVPFEIGKGELDTANALSATNSEGKTEYTYGDTVKISFTAAPAQGTVKKSTARNAQEGTVAFYHGDTLLGTVAVVNGKATLLYDTTKRQIPVGQANITAEFSGNDRLEAAEFTAKDLFTLQKKKPEPQTDIQSISLNDFVYDGKTMTTEITGITWKDPSLGDITFEGTAELNTPYAGSYGIATITKLSLTGESNKWYDATPFAGNISNVNVNPKVVIHKAAGEGTVFKTLTFGQDEASGKLEFDQTIIPDELELVSVDLGDTSGYGRLISNVNASSTEVTFDLAAQEGEGTIPVIFIFKNHEDLQLEIKVVKTAKQVVDPNFRASDMEYTGSPYDGWSVESYSKDQVTATYYDLDEGKDLGETAPKDAGNYSVTLSLNTDSAFAEATLNFTITKRQTVLQALERQIKIGETAPDLSAPKEGTDYEFTEGKPIAGDHIGLIKMAYAKTPNTAQAGTYDIQIGIVGETNENYSVTTKGAQLNVAAEEPPVTPPTGGGGSGGGGGGGTATPPTEDNNITNDAGDKTTTVDTETTVTNGNATAEIDKDTADKIVENAVENKSKAIILDAKTTAGTAEKTEVKLPAETVKAIVTETEAEVVVETDTAELELDRKAVEAIAATAETGTVSIIAENTENAADRAAFQLKIVTAAGEVKDFSGGNVTVTVKLNKELAAKDLTCVYIDDNGKYTKVGGQKNADGTFTFTTTHFSTYVIMAEAEADKIIEEQEAEAELARLKAGVQATTYDLKAEPKYGKNTLTWVKKPGYKVDKVEVYRATEDGEFEPLYTTKSGAVKTYSNTKDVKEGTAYIYKIRGVRTLGDEIVYTQWSNEADVTAIESYSKYLTNGVKNTKITASSKAVKGKFTVNWKKSGVFKMDHFQVYRSTKKNTGYKKVYTTKTGDTRSVHSTKLTKGKTYYFKIRGVRKVSGKTVYTDFSNIAYRKAK